MILSPDAIYRFTTGLAEPIFCPEVRRITMTIEPWDHCLALLEPGSALYTAMSERRAAGEELPGPVVVFLNSISLPGSLGPHDLVRRKDASKHFGVRQTSIDELVNSGSIPAPLPLTPGGISVGWLGATILSHQLTVLLRGIYGSELEADARRNARLMGKARAMRKAQAARG
jgi:hypothetical protein